jgi:hypothetical protein
MGFDMIKNGKLLNHIEMDGRVKKESKLKKDELISYIEYLWEHNQHHQILKLLTSEHKQTFDSAKLDLVVIDYLFDTDVTTVGVDELKEFINDAVLNIPTLIPFVNDMLFDVVSRLNDDVISFSNQLDNLQVKYDKLLSMTKNEPVLKVKLSDGTNISQPVSLVMHKNEV